MVCAVLSVAPLCVRALQCAFQFLLHPIEGRCERFAPADQDVIMAGPHPFAPRQSYRLAQPAAHAIAFHRISNFPRDGEPDPGRLVVAAMARLQDEGRASHLDPGRGVQKISTPAQSLHRGTPAAASRAEALAPACAALRDHLAAAFGRHAGTESVTALAHEL